MHHPLRVALALLVATAACKGSSHDAPKAHLPEPVGTPNDAAIDAPQALTPLPAEGMLCGDGDRAWVWAADGTFTPVVNQRGEPDVRLVLGADGSVAQNELDVLVPRTGTPAPIAKPPDGVFEYVTIAKSGSALGYIRGHAMIARGGTWRTVGTEPIVDAIEYAGTWWVETTKGVFRETPEGLTAVEVPMAQYHRFRPGGLAEIDGKLFVFGAADYNQFEKNLWMWPIVDNVVGKPRAIGELITNMISKPVALTRGASWATFHQGGVFGTIFASIGGKKPVLLRQDAQNLWALDGYDRVWFQTREGVIAHAADGTEQLYPASTHPLFSAANQIVHCAVLGKGFATLPAAGAQQTGTLALDFTNAPNAKFAACDRPPGMSGCQDDPNAVTGTLDEIGRWTGPVPIGSWAVSVLVNGNWLTSEYYSSCLVKAGETCTVNGTTK